MVRKKRSLFGFVYLLAVPSSNFYIDYYVPGSSLIYLIIICILALFPGYACYLAIEAFSSYDIGTWKHSKHVKHLIYAGCYFSIILGIILYYYLKQKEKRYMITNQQ